MEGGEKTEVKAKFVELEYEIETGEAERIAVDGISRGAMEGGAEDNPSEVDLEGTSTDPLSSCRESENAEECDTNAARAYRCLAPICDGGGRQ